MPAPLERTTIRAHDDANFSLEIVFVTFMAILFSDIGLSWHELFHRRS